MKILIASDWYKPTVNGVVVSVLNLQSELIKLGHEVRILTLSNNSYSYKVDNVVYLGSVSAEKIYPEARLRIPLTSGYVEELVEWQPDIIHTQCEFSTFITAKRISKKLNVPIVHTYHTVYEDYTHYFSPNKEWGRHIVASFSRRILENVEKVIVPTGKVKKLLEGYEITQEIQIVPTGIDITAFQNQISSDERIALRHKLGISNSDSIVLYIGRLGKEKNLEEVISFLEKINMENLVFLVVGGGPYKEKLKEFTANLNMDKKVIFAGMVPPVDIGKYYALGDLFVSASNSETQGLTYIESMASGLPALCREDPCLEGVIFNGVNGWQYNGFEDFKEKLEQFFANSELKVNMSAKAVEIAESNFSKEAFGKNIERIYKTLL